MNLKRFRLHPFSIFPIESFLGNLTDINLWIEVRGKCLMMVTCVTVDNIQVLYLVKVMLGSISRIDTGYTRIKATSENCRQACLLETLTISPLP